VEGHEIALGRVEDRVEVDLHVENVWRHGDLTSTLVVSRVVHVGMSVACLAKHSIV
jgi:hypothetical protein